MSFISKYLTEVLLAVIAALLIGCGTLWHFYSERGRDISDLEAVRDELTVQLKAEKDWSAKLSDELANRATKQKSSNGQKKSAEDKLDKSYEKNRDWADAPVPDDTVNGLRDFLKSR